MPTKSRRAYALSHRPSVTPTSMLRLRSLARCWPCGLVRSYGPSSAAYRTATSVCSPASARSAAGSWPVPARAQPFRRSATPSPRKAPPADHWPAVARQDRSRSPARSRPAAPGRVRARGRHGAGRGAARGAGHHPRPRAGGHRRGAASLARWPQPLRSRAVAVGAALAAAHDPAASDPTDPGGRSRPAPALRPRP